MLLVLGVSFCTVFTFYMPRQSLVSFRELNEHFSGKACLTIRSLYIMSIRYFVVVFSSHFGFEGRTLSSRSLLTFHFSNVSRLK